MFVALRLGSLVRAAAVVALIVGFLVMLLAVSNGSNAAPAAPAGAAPATTTHQKALEYTVRGTGASGLNLRECAAVTCTRVATIPVGGTFAATCSTAGDRVEGQGTWLRGTFGDKTGFAAAKYLQGAGQVPDCDAPAPLPAHAETLAAG